jgi:transcriptional regulator with XRE-family HTH domain
LSSGNNGRKVGAVNTKQGGFFMKTTKEFLKELKEKQGFTSDYALAAFLNLNRANISMYQSGKRIPDDYICAKIAEGLEIPAITVIAAANMEREKDEDKKEYWRNFYERLGGIAASVMAVLALSHLGFDLTAALPYGLETLKFCILC